MRCGTVGAIRGVFEQIPDDPHDASRQVGHETVPLTPAAHAWLSEWPRAVGDPLAPRMGRDEPTFFMPAELRCADAAALGQAESEARAKSSARVDERMRAAGVPSAPPPDDLPPGMWQFKAAWDALRRRHDDGILDEILTRRTNPMSIVR
jgi:hypothetical protein